MCVLSSLKLNLKKQSTVPVYSSKLFCVKAEFLKFFLVQNDDQSCPDGIDVGYLSKIDVSQSSCRDLHICLSSSYTVLMHGTLANLDFLKMYHKVMCTSPVTENLCYPAT